MERIYREVPLDRIPWNLGTPPEALKSAITAYAPPGGRIIDLGCGAGNHVIYLARLGYAVTGIDISGSAIDIAKRTASSAGVECEFAVTDVREGLPGMGGEFDFAYDWELLHHIFPDERDGYAANVARLLKSDGRYLSVCFSEDNPRFGGSGKYRRTPLGTILYFSSEKELKALFEKHFRVEDLRTIDVEGRNGVHKAIHGLMRRKGG